TAASAPPRPAAPPAPAPTPAPAPSPTPPAPAPESSPGAFFESVSKYRPLEEAFRNGFAAGLYDVVALFAAASQESNGVDNQKTLALLRCLDGKGRSEERRVGKEGEV